MAFAGGNLIKTGLNNVWKFVPLILLILIFEGTFRRLSWWLMVAYMFARTFQTVKLLYSTGYIDNLGQALWGKKK